MLVVRPPDVDHWVEVLDDALGHEHDCDYGMWWLAKSRDGSRLLLVHTRGIADHKDDYCLVCHTRDHPTVIHHGRTVRTYAYGFGCMVFSKDSTQFDPDTPWERIIELGGDSLFLGVNYPVTPKFLRLRCLLCHPPQSQE